MNREIKEHVELVANSAKTIQEVNELHNEVTKYHTTPEQRVIGFVMYSAKIEINVDPPKCGFTKDWAFVGVELRPLARRYRCR